MVGQEEMLISHPKNITGKRTKKKNYIYDNENQTKEARKPHTWDPLLFCRKYLGLDGSTKILTKSIFLLLHTESVYNICQVIRQVYKRVSQSPAYTIYPHQSCLGRLRGTRSTNNFTPPKAGGSFNPPCRSTYYVTIIIVSYCQGPAWASTSTSFTGSRSRLSD